MAVQVTAPEETAPLVLPELKSATGPRRFAAVDALAAVAEDGALLISVVHRGSSGPIRLAVQVEGATTGPQAELLTLSADVPWAANTLESPAAIQPRLSAAEVHDGRLTLTAPPYTWLRLRIPRAGKP